MTNEFNSIFFQSLLSAFGAREHKKGLELGGNLSALEQLVIAIEKVFDKKGPKVTLLRLLKYNYGGQDRTSIYSRLKLL